MEYYSLVYIVSKYGIVLFIAQNRDRLSFSLDGGIIFIQVPTAWCD